MSQSNNTDRWHVVRARFIDAPTGLKAFALFACIVSSLSLLISLLSDSLTELLLPITGWNMGWLYVFCLIIIGSYLVSHQSQKRLLKCIYGCLAVLLSFFIFGLIDLLNGSTGQLDNPYLYESPWRPVWTMFVPLIWMIVLLFPVTRNYIIRPRFDTPAGKN